MMFRGGVAHLGERLNGIQEVRGSIPLISTKKHTWSFDRVCFFCIEKDEGDRKAVKKTLRWSVFRPWRWCRLFLESV